jgi:uncharacterized membrane protein
MAFSGLERVRAHLVFPHVGPELKSTERWISALTGSALIGHAILRPRASSVVELAAGAYGIYRGATGRCPITRSLAIGRGIGSRREPIETRASITVDGDPDLLFDRWRRVERWPEWMRFVVSAARENGHIRFSIQPPEDLRSGPIEIEGTFLEHVSQREIHFETLESSRIYFSSRARFEAAPDGVSTEIHAHVEYAIPAGKLAAGMAAVLGGAPDQQIRSDLRRFKQWIEVGAVTTTLGQPNGSRRGPLTRFVGMRERLEQGAPLALSEPPNVNESIDIVEMPPVTEVRP